MKIQLVNHYGTPCIYVVYWLGNILCGHRDGLAFGRRFKFLDYVSAMSCFDTNTIYER